MQKIKEYTLFASTGCEKSKTRCNENNWKDFPQKQRREIYIIWILKSDVKSALVKMNRNKAEGSAVVATEMLSLRRFQDRYVYEIINGI